MPAIPISELLDEARCYACYGAGSVPELAKLALLSRIASGGGGFDPDAQNFFDRAGITDSAQKTAVNNLVVGLKAASLWTKMIALYPFVGGTATSHAENLINSSYQIAWHGTVTHDANGITGNGSTGYGSCTGLSYGISSSLSGLGVYSRTTVTGSAQNVIGSSSAAFSSNIKCLTSGPPFSGDAQIGQPGVARIAITAANSPVGLWLLDKSSTTRLDYYANGASTANYTTLNTTAPDGSIFFIEALNSSGTPVNFSSKNLSAAMLFTSMSSGEHASFYTLIQAYQTALGRQV